MMARSVYCCLACSLGNRVTWEISGNIVYLDQYENRVDSPKGHHFESCLKASQECRQNILVQIAKLSARIRWVVGDR